MKTLLAFLLCLVSASLLADVPPVLAGHVRVYNSWTNVWYAYDPDADAMFTVNPGQTVDVFPLSSVAANEVLLGQDPTAFAPGMYSTPSGGGVTPYPAATNAVYTVVIAYSTGGGRDTPFVVSQGMTPAMYPGGMDPSQSVFTMITGTSPYVWIGSGFALGLVIYGFVWYRRIAAVAVQDTL